MACLVCLEELALGIRSLVAYGGERCDGVAHAKRALVRQKLGSNVRAVECTRHDLEAAKPALRRPVGEAAVHGEEREEVARLKRPLNALVKPRALRGKAVRAVLGQLVGEVPRGDVDHLTAEDARDPLDQGTQTIVGGRGEARESYAYKLIITVVFLDKVYGNHSRVVEGGVPLALRSGGEALGFAGGGERAHKLGVVGCLIASLRCAKLREASRRPRSRRDGDRDS